MRVWPGRAYPLGATWDGEGVNFALFSEHAEKVELCLFDAPLGAGESHRVELRDRTHGVWHAYLPDVRPGVLYGYRVDGRYAPSEGYRFNANKLLIDPYAKAISAQIDWNDALFGYDVTDSGNDLSFSKLDSAAFVPKSVVVDSSFAWGDDRHPRIPWTHTVIYEAHVRGLTMQHPDVPETLRGTYLGIASEPIIDHLTSLGITAVELMPVHQFVVGRHLIEQGLTNYWGYHSIGFFAPDVRYATAGSGEQVSEFKTMVKRLHSAGIEVILDVVYNHTGEGSQLGPTVGLRGIDNAAYYRLSPEDPRYYVDFTGCGNSLNMVHPRTIQLIMDSLRYWVQEMHVDGFRFDLAPVLARELHELDRLGRFFAIIQQDPIISQAKLIAEPWDLGPDGYQAGHFPGGWAEWNGRYRDEVRRFWRGDQGLLAELATRLSGSSDLFGDRRRHTSGSINFVTCHDGFSLHDLVSYAQKHNEANGEENRDGTDENYSANWGVEGNTHDSGIVELRERIKRNFLATLAFSQGVPMICAGDKMNRTQNGNNNAYCQDNEISWVDWSLDDRKRDMLAFTRDVLRIRRDNPVLRRRGFFLGARLEDQASKDVTWVRPDGREMTNADWSDPNVRTLGMLIHGHATDEVDERGRRITGSTLLLLVNGGGEPRDFVLPHLDAPGLWRELLQSAQPDGGIVDPAAVNVEARSLVLLAYEGA